MTIPTPLQDLQDDVLNETGDWCSTKWVLESPPRFFSGMSNADYWQWKRELAVRLDVDPKNLLVTGSAAVGYSLNPRKGFKPFDEKSDIDLAVVSTYHFELAWRELRNLGTKFYQLRPGQQYAVRDHQRRLIYYGTIATDKLLPILPFAEQWLQALQDASEGPPVNGRTVNARIYRDYASVRSYLHLTFRNLRDRLLGEPEAVDERIPETD